MRVYRDHPLTPYIYTQPLTFGAHAKRLPAGPLRECMQVRKKLQCSDPTQSPGPFALDLDATRLAFGWAYRAFEGGEGLSHATSDACDDACDCTITASTATFAPVARRAVARAGSGTIATPARSPRRPRPSRGS